MAIPGLPEDLAAFLRSGAPCTLDAGHYETITLVPLEQLRIETLPVTPNLAPFANDHPHINEYGHYAVPAVNLVQGHPDRPEAFPAWLLLWLPNERRYGSYDLDHGDLMVFGPKVSWSKIAADPMPFIEASDGQQIESVEIEFLRPWPKYPFVAVEYPD